MTDSTPSTPSSETTSAPAPAVSSAPSSQPDTTTSAAPPSWEQALESAGLSGGPDPDATTEAPSAPDPATTGPEAPLETPVPAPLDTKGPIPYERHEAILQNARRKAAEEVVGQVRTQFGPAIQFQQQLHAQPVETLSQIISEAVDDPAIGGQIIAHLARTLSSRRGAGKVVEEPQPDLQTETGDLVYSAGQLQKREAWLRQQMSAEFDTRFAPVERERQARAQEAEAARVRQETSQTVTANLKAFESRPGFSEHKAEIATRQQEYVAQGMNMWTALGAAYHDVLTEKVWPKQQAAMTNKFVQGAAAKAQASTGNPAAVAPSTARRPTTWEEALAQQGL